MTDALSVLRGALYAYLVLVGLLGLVTLTWSLANLFVLDGAALASAWFAVAGSGTLLVAVLILRHAYPGGAETAA